MVALRRSPRLKKIRLYSSSSDDKDHDTNGTVATPKAKSVPRAKNKRKVTSPSSLDPDNKDEAPPVKKKQKRSTPRKQKSATILPRTRQNELLSSSMDFVFGVDEAGRGPLAGPVVVAAAHVPTDIAGIVDSKSITKEAVRQELFCQILSSRNVRYAICVVPAGTIDNVNILQATYLGMRLVAKAMVQGGSTDTTRALPLFSTAHSNNNKKKTNEEKKDEVFLPTLNIEDISDADEPLVFLGATTSNQQDSPEQTNEIVTTVPSFVGNDNIDSKRIMALVDGNRSPPDMPCEVETMVKGDSHEYCIAAASILAKVTRDAIMRHYDSVYPQYELHRHKGYPTAAHIALIQKHGILPIHRTTFAPLKHMK